MRRTKKVFFIDLDGTLLADNKEISAKTVEVVNKAKLLGHEIIICTGRSINRAEKFIEELGCNYAIYANGNIFDCNEQKVIYENVMPVNEILKVYENSDRDGVNVVFISGTVRYRTKSFRFGKEILKRDDILIEGPIEKFLMENKVVQTIAVSKDYETIVDIKKTVEKALTRKSRVKVINQSKSVTDPNFAVEDFTYIDFANKDSNKGNGIKRFCKMFGIAKADRIAIGDDLNDFSMFKACGYKVAMKNSLTELKNLADYITDDNNSDGVAKFIESMLNK